MDDRHIPLGVLSTSFKFTDPLLSYNLNATSKTGDIKFNMLRTTLPISSIDSCRWQEHTFLPYLLQQVIHLWVFTLIGFFVY